MLPTASKCESGHKATLEGQSELEKTGLFFLSSFQLLLNSSFQFWTLSTMDARARQEMVNFLTHLQNEVNRLRAKIQTEEGMIPSV